MDSKEKDLIDFSNKILKGAQLAIDELIEERKKEDSYLVISENGKVIRKPAREI